MSIDEAQKNIGAAVVYDPGFGCNREDGTIVRVTHQYVMVRYGHNDTSIRATAPENLTLLSESLGATNA